MPLNVKKFGASCVLILIFLFAAFAQAPPAAATAQQISQAPSAADVMRERINKVKAMIALKSYSAAIYELEGIRRTTSDSSVISVIDVMLMNCYLEQADYKRAQQLLTELFNAQKINKPNANYYAVAAQVVKGARSHHERYKSLGLIVSDPTLPPTAVTDLDKMRETVETVVEQAKTLGANKKDAPLAMALLEEATNARGSLARDDYDSKRWKEEIADARESLMNSRSTVNAVDDSAMTQPTPPGANTSAVNTGAPKQGETASSSSSSPAAAFNPVSNPALANANPAANNDGAKTDSPAAAGNTRPDNSSTVKSPETAASKTEAAAASPNAQTSNAENGSPQAPVRSRRVPGTTDSPAAANNQQNSAETAAADAPTANTPMVVGSLVEYATEKVSPTYPPAARTIRQTGIVRVEVLVDEDGRVLVENSSGPSLLQRAALDAVKKWKFKPFTRDGQPVKAKGFVNFNFNL